MILSKFNVLCYFMNKSVQTSSYWGISYLEMINGSHSCMPMEIVIIFTLDHYIGSCSFLMFLILEGCKDLNKWLLQQQIVLAVLFTWNCIFVTMFFRPLSCEFLLCRYIKNIGFCNFFFEKSFGKLIGYTTDIYTLDYVINMFIWVHE